MLKKIKAVILSLSLLGGLAAPLAIAGVASAQGTVSESLCQGGSNLKIPPATGAPIEGQETCRTTTQDSTSKLNQLITNIVNIFSIIVGIVAVIMIIIGGFKYITSGGDSGNVTSAKNTILYAVIGLVIVALAQFIVRFVLAKAGNITTTE